MNTIEVERDLMERSEDVSILERYRTCVQNMVSARSRGERFVPKNWLCIFDTPETTCEYTEEQYTKVVELKEELQKVVHTLGYTIDDPNTYVLAE